MDEQTAFYNTLYPFVVQVMKEEGINPGWAPITTSQAMIETSWGKDPTVAINNFWGMKAAKGQNSKSFSTREGYGKNTKRIEDEFLSFPTMEEGVRYGIRRLKNKFRAYQGDPSAQQYVTNINGNPKALYFTGDPALYIKNLDLISNGSRAKIAHDNYQQEQNRIEKAKWDDYSNSLFTQKPDITQIPNPYAFPMEQKVPTYTNIPDGNYVQVRRERVDPGIQRAMQALDAADTTRRIFQMFDWNNQEPPTYTPNTEFKVSYDNGGHLKSWDSLSMAEKADIMSMAIQEGIYNLDNIKGIYNKFAEGGLFDGVDAAPKIPTLDEYYAQRAAEEQEKYYLQGSRNRKESVPILINGSPAFNCLATALANNPNKGHYVTGNRSFAAHPDKYGFKKVPKEEAKLGSLVQLVKKGDPYHAMILNSLEGQNKPMTFNYSPGAYPQYKVGGRYPVEVGEKYDFYNFVGNEADSARWKNEYEQLYNNEYAGGGKIYIKPENKGKFTALKKRTGKSASWFKEHGTPAQKKMAIFALNSKKWKHDGGGLLDLI